MSNIYTLASQKVDEQQVRRAIERGVSEAVEKMNDADLLRMMTAPLADFLDENKAAA